MRWRDHGAAIGLALAALLAGCADGDEVGPCAARTGGALVALDIAGESFTVWSTNDEFIAEAEALAQGGQQRIPLFNRLIDGTDCDPQWSWHVDPSDMTWVDSTIELCDAVPSGIEDDKAYWLDDVDQFCPWAAAVVDVSLQ
jgi:hypothetical protein